MTDTTATDSILYGIFDKETKGVVASATNNEDVINYINYFGIESVVSIEIPIGCSTTYLKLTDDNSAWEWNTMAFNQWEADKSYVRAKRETLLMKTDYINYNEVPIDPVKKEHMYKYRQWLRDLPQIIDSRVIFPGYILRTNLEYDVNKEY